MNQSRHLPPEIVYGYERQMLTVEELRLVHQHMETCEECRNLLALRLDAGGAAEELRKEFTARHRPAQGFLPWAAAAALLLTAGGFGWWRFRSIAEQVAEQGRAPEAQLELPAFLGELNPPAEKLMGAETPAQPSHFSPEGTAVMSAHPVFQWQPLGADWKYEVRVFSLDGETLEESPLLAQASWASSGSLKPDVTYQWQVLAIRGSARRTLPPPPALPPRFRVLAPAVADRLHKLAEGKRLSHSGLAAAYGREGLIEEARGEIAKGLQESPGDQELQKMSETLSKLTGRLPRVSSP